MTTHTARAVVAGAGPAGLASACLLAQAGINTVCIAPDATPDPRTTALMAPSIRMLESLGVWTDGLREHCAPLKQLHLLDDTGNLVAAPDLRFSAREIGLEQFGWNVPLAALLPALKAQAEATGVVFVADELNSAELNETSVRITTRHGTHIDAVFAVGADGRNSLLRKAAGIHAREWSFDQSALITRFSHTRAHEVACLRQCLCPEIARLWFGWINLTI
jgi:2-octaprenyl-6-methoxyphenol hydroxylase